MRHVLALLALPALACAESPRRDGPDPATRAGHAHTSTPTAAPASPPYRIEVVGAEVAVGEEAMGTVTVLPEPGHHINLDYPQRLTIAPVAGVRLLTAELSLADAQIDRDRRLTFTVAAVPERAGAFALDGELRLSVCGDDTCTTARAPVKLALTAQ